MVRSFCLFVRRAFFFFAVSIGFAPGYQWKMERDNAKPKRSDGLGILISKRLETVCRERSKVPWGNCRLAMAKLR